MATKVTIKINCDGEAASGKTRALDAIIQSLVYVGRVHTIRRDDDKHTATIVLVSSRDENGTEEIA